jgi:3-dehydroquinate dehydratase/shikimate dehydrogenase
MSKLCLCLTAKTIQRNLEILTKYRKNTDLAELRVDCLDPDERLYIRRFPELAGLPVILTIRRDVDGGHFTGGEGARVKLLANGIAFANTDSRYNYAYVDIEDDFEVPSLEEAARTFGTKIIRSCHSLNGFIENIPKKIKSMQRSGDEIVKIAVTVKSSNDVLQVLKASKKITTPNKILICMGHYGIYSRILADRFGSYLSYSSALSESEVPGAPGQMDISELAELYHVQKITSKTKVYGIIGYPLKASVSPWFFNTVFNLENADAVYVPFPTDSINDFLEIAEALDVKGLSITVPYKEAIIPNLIKCSETVRAIGACNTISHFEDGWHGDNTDCGGFSESLLNFINRKNFKYLKATIIGAGGVARSVASEIHRMGGKALILNRTVYKARNIALKYNFKWGGLDNQGIEQMSKYSDIIIQTSSVGMEGYEASDPLDLYSFTGDEVVMDLIYVPPVTPFLKRAMSAGCRTFNGYDMVIRQACMQYAHFTGTELPQKVLSQFNSMGANTWNKIRSA